MHGSVRCIDHQFSNLRLVVDNAAVGEGVEVCAATSDSVAGVDGLVGHTPDAAVLPGRPLSALSRHNMHEGGIGGRGQMTSGCGRVRA